MLVVVCVLLFGFFVNADDKYTTKYDNVDFDEIIHSERLLKNYVNCLLEEGPCSPDGTELKNVLPDALNTGCSKCSEKQKSGARKVIRHLVNNKHEWWALLLAKYDPNGIFVAKFQDDWINGSQE